MGSQCNLSYLLTQIWDTMFSVNIYTEIILEFAFLETIDLFNIKYNKIFGSIFNLKVKRSPNSFLDL